jgi:hypothetical protein
MDDDVQTVDFVGVMFCIVDVAIKRPRRARVAGSRLATMPAATSP